MNTELNNGFVIGPQASGNSFFGRKTEISVIESIFTNVSAIHLVGPTRIGKSSLINRVFEKNRDYPNRICIRITMGEHNSAISFWKGLFKKIRKQIISASLSDIIFEIDFNTIDEICYSKNDDDWFVEYTMALQSILEHINKIGYRLVLSIDEFDYVIKVFGDAPHYYQLLRSIYSEPDYATSGVIISRRRLDMLEAKCTDISTFHGVFREIPLHVFNDSDMIDYYDFFESKGIHISPGGKKKLENYTGRIPYLCSMFAGQILFDEFDKETIGDKEIERVFKFNWPQIQTYYNDLLKLLDYDNQIETMYYLAFTSKFPANVTNRDIDTMTRMGSLIMEENNGLVKYYAYTKDFMTWFRLQPLKLPTWETMTQSEKKIKAIFKKEYPEIDEIRYELLMTDDANNIIRNLNARYPELNLRATTIKKYSEDLSAHKENPSILDVLTLSEVVNIILDTWSARFHKYFSGDKSWKDKLKFIKDLRNPIAHAAIEYISQNDLAVCMRYCDEILHMKY